MVDAYFYDADGSDKQVKLTATVVNRIAQNQLLWVDSLRQDSAALKSAAKLLNLPAAALSGALRSRGYRLDNFDNHFQFSLPLPPTIGGGEARIDFMVSEKWLFTIRDVEVPYLAEFREQDRGESLKGRLSPVAMVAALLGWHLESYQADIAEILKAVDKIDGEVLAEREKRPPLADLAKMRARVSGLRDRLGEHRSIMRGLTRPDFSPLSGKPEADLFCALERLFERTEDGVDRAREVVIGSFELYATRTAQDTNQLVKTLTLVTVMIGFAGAIAGIFGMNFDTPIAKTGLAGFAVTTATMVAVAVIVAIVAKRRGWL